MRKGPMSISWGRIGVLVGSILAACPVVANSGEYVGRASWEFVATGASEGPILDCEITHVGGTAFSLACYLRSSDSTRPGPVQCTGYLVGTSAVALYCSAVLAAIPGDAPVVTHTSVALDLSTLSGPYRNTTLHRDSHGVVQMETEEGTATLIAP